MSWAGSRVMSRPSNVTRPEREGITPEMVRSSVVLPAPLAPIRVTISPASAHSVTPFSAWTAP